MYSHFRAIFWNCYSVLPLGSAPLFFRFKGCSYQLPQQESNGSHLEPRMVPDVHDEIVGKNGNMSAEKSENTAATSAITTRSGQTYSASELPTVLEPLVSSTSTLTLSEKLNLISGKSLWFLADVPRLKIPSIRVSDGPHGVRKVSNKCFFRSYWGIKAKRCRISTFHHSWR